MPKMKLNRFLSGFICCIIAFSDYAFAQDDRAQLPPLLNNSYFEVNIGYIQYPFNDIQLESGYIFKSVNIPHAAVRIIPAGYEFNKYLSAQITYMRPVLWVQYTYDKGAADTERTRSVWMNVAGLTVKPSLPISDHLSIYGEGGLAIITRKGFHDDDYTPILKNANYSTFQLGGGIKYHVNKNWNLMLSMVYSPENKNVKQPATSFVSGGFSYKLLPFTEEQLDESAKTGYIHPKQTIQLGFTSNLLGYGVNNFFSEGKVPVFWAGEAEVRNGLSINYQRNIFHGARVFALAWGASFSVWLTDGNEENFFTLSIYPVLKFTFLHTRPADLYFFYTLAGPAYISKTALDDKELGRHFTFQDNMGLGVYFGEKRKLNTEIKIGHYSNGDLFPSNEGVKIPLSLNLGYSF